MTQPSTNASVSIGDPRIFAFVLFDFCFFLEMFVDFPVKFFWHKFVCRLAIMLETLFVVYILLLFIFPLPVFMCSLAVAAYLLVYKKYLLIRCQPAPGRKLLLATGLADFANFTASLLLALALANIIHFLVFDYFYLFVFNTIFCFGISQRWFDFAYAIYRKAALNLKCVRQPPNVGAVFVTCTGYRKADGWGSGLIPVFMDSGYLSFGEAEAVFDGVFLRYEFDAYSDFQISRKSSDKIKLFLNAKKSDIPADAILFAVREQFYPFKSKETRETLIRNFEKIHSRETSATSA